METLALVSLEDLRILIAENSIKNEVWTCAEAAKYLKVHPTTVARQADKGVIPGVKIGTDWKFSSIALYELVAKKKRWDT